MMFGIFIVILLAYLSYIFLLHPWERKALLTQKANLTVNVVDCESGYPINNATVYIYSREGELIKESLTSNGQFVYSDYPNCFRIKVSFFDEQYREVCVGSGDDKVVNFCYEYPEASPYVLHYQEDIGVIGGTSGEVINIKSFPNTVLSYPLSNSTINYPSYFLYSNLLWSEGMGVTVKNIDVDITKSVGFSFTLQSKRGNPTIKVYANDKLLFSDKVQAMGNVSVMVPRQSLNQTINFDVKCDFDGWLFWTTQDCNLSNIKVNQQFYTPKKVKQVFNFSTSTVERNADIIELGFVSFNEASGGVRADINDVEVFDSNSLTRRNYSATAPTVNLNLNESGNKLVFHANPSAEAFLREIKLYFYTPVTGDNQEEFTFYASNSELKDVNKAFINFFVENIYYNGLIGFKINNIYYYQVVDKAGWNTIVVDATDLLNSNEVMISAPEGRFELGDVRISYE